jgi:Cu(I)/Ag(I) efflux system membrane fusion protein
MKKILLSIALISIIGFISTSCNKKEEKKIESSTSVAGVQYTCPMHPEVVTDAPGTCPKCGMDLVKKESAAPMDSTMSMDTTKKM